MQQTPTQAHTLDTLKTALVTHKPELESILDTVFSTFAEADTPSEEIAEQLKTMLHRDITPGEAEGARTFTWRNPSNQPIVLTIPLNDTDGDESDESADAASEEENQDEAPTEATAASEAEAEAEAEIEVEAELEAPEPPQAATDDPNDEDEQDAPERERINLLDELDALLGDANLHLIIQRTGKKDDQNILSVTVVPQAKNDKTDPALLTPINLKGTARELEAGLVQAIRITTDGNDSIEQALAELEEAKKEAAEAKKAEAAKSKKAASKSKAAAAKKDEKPAEPPAPSLFDAPAEDPKDKKTETTKASK